jgi:hypothetical protein
MKYAPRHNPLRGLNYKSKAQLGRHLSFVHLYPGDKLKPYGCMLCKLRFRTVLGASNHVDFEHTEEVWAALKEVK